MRTLRVAIGQINRTVGDIGGNSEKITQLIHEANSLGVDLLTFAELATTGYPPGDLPLKLQFIRQNKACLDEIVRHSSGIAVVVGFVDSNDEIYNAAATIYDGKLVGVYHKICLPSYGVFDENGYFQAGTEHLFSSFTELA